MTSNTKNETIYKIPSTAVDPIVQNYIHFWFHRSITTRNMKGDTPLLEAIRNKDVASIFMLLLYRSILTKGEVDTTGIHTNGTATVERKDMLRIPTLTGETCLHLAARLGQETIVRLILDQSLESTNNNNDVHRLKRNSWLVNVLDRVGGTALHAVSAVEKTEHSSIVQLLLDRGVSVTCRNQLGDTALHYAAKQGHVNIIRQILLSSSSSSQDVRDDTVLQDTIRRLHTGLFQQTDADGDTALHIAAMHGKVNVIRVLLLDPTTKEGKSTKSQDDPLLHVIQNPNISNTRSGDTALHKAICEGQHDVVRELLYYGADVNKPNYKGVTALHHCCNIGRSTATRAANSNNNDNDDNDNANSHSTQQQPQQQSLILHLGHLLLQHGASVHAVDRGGRTPLHYAAKRGHDGMVRLLLDKGANMDVEDNYGFTPLRIASMRRRCNKNAHVIRLLHTYGAS